MLADGDEIYPNLGHEPREIPRGGEFLIEQFYRTATPHNRDVVAGTSELDLSCAPLKLSVLTRCVTGAHNQAAPEWRFAHTMEARPRLLA